MTQYIRNWTSDTPGERPVYGEIPLGAVGFNRADLQAFVGGPAPVDLLPIRHYSAQAAYAPGDLVVTGGGLYRAREAMSPGAFDPDRWELISSAAAQPGIGLRSHVTARALRDSGPGAPSEARVTLGALAAGDGGGGAWRWDAASTADDDLGTVLLPAGHVGAGRWERVMSPPHVYHPEWWGAARDGATDDGPALQAAISAALAVGGEVRLTAGKYGTAQTLSNWQSGDDFYAGQRLAIVGMGMDSTFIVGLPGLTGPILEIREMRYADTEDGSGYDTLDGADYAGIDLTTARCGLRLEAFGLSGDRAYSHQGLRFVGRNDRVVARDLFISHCTLGGLRIGDIDDNLPVANRGFIRESLFQNVKTRFCGSSGVADWGLYTSTDSSADGSNLTSFVDCESGYFYSRSLEWISTTFGATANRRMTFDRFTSHGAYPIGFGEAPEGQIYLRGNLRLFQFRDCRIAGQHPGSFAFYIDEQDGLLASQQVNTGVIEWSNTYNPSGNIHGVHVGAGWGLDIRYQGSVPLESPRIALEVANTITGDVSYRSPFVTTDNLVIGDTAKRYVSVGGPAIRQPNSDYACGQIVSGRLVFENSADRANPPTLHFWDGGGDSDSSPNGAVSANAGSLLVKGLNNNLRQSRMLFVKAFGDADTSPDTGWRAVQMIEYAGTAQRPASPENGMCYFDTNLGKPIWWDGSAWVDATGTAV